MDNFNKKILTQSIIVLKKCKNIPNEAFTKSNLEQPLTGMPFDLNPVEMVYFLFELEQEFNVKIPSSMLVDYNFSSIMKICDCIRALIGIRI